MVQSRRYTALLPTILLLVVDFPAVSSQYMRGTSTSDLSIDTNEQRRLGWLFDMIKDLSEESDPVTSAVTPFVEENTDKEENNNNNNKKKKTKSNNNRKKKNNN